MEESFGLRVFRSDHRVSVRAEVCSYVRPVVRFIPARRAVTNKASNPRWTILPNIVTVNSVSWRFESEECGKVRRGGHVGPRRAQHARQFTINVIHD